MVGADVGAGWLSSGVAPAARGGKGRMFEYAGGDALRPRLTGSVCVYCVCRPGEIGKRAVVWLLLLVVQLEK